MSKKLILSMLTIGMLSGGVYNEAFAMQSENVQTASLLAKIALKQEDAKKYLVEAQKLVDESYGDDVSDELATFRIPDTYKSIEKEAFKDAFKDAPDIKFVVIPNGVTRIGEGAFKGANDLESITIPDSVASIDKEAFEGCARVNFIVPSNEMKNYLSKYHGIKKGKIEVKQELVTDNEWKWPKDGIVKIPNGTAVIEANMFANRNDLRRFEIPDSVSSLNSLAFDKIKEIVELIVPSQQMEDSINATFKGVSYNFFVDVDERLATEENKWKWPTDGIIQVPEGVKDICDRMFYQRNDVKSVVMHDDIKSIGNFAFGECSELTSVKLPAKLELIGNSAFDKCKKLPSIEIPDGVKTIGNRAFAMCQQLRTIEIPDSVTSIGMRAFALTAKNGVIVHSEEVKKLVIASGSKGS